MTYGTIKLHLKPSDPQQGENAINRPVTQTQWEDIMGTLNGEYAYDVEAVAWAYKKLMAFGVAAGSLENALMMDRLNLMLLLEP